MSNKNDPVQARMINEVLYCERLMYLERVQGEFEHNYFTVDGNAAHKRADVPGGELPPVDDREDRPYKARSVWLSSDTLGITAKIDVVEGVGGIVTPIEYKRGSPPDVLEGAYLPERAQVCAQVLLLREHGYHVDEGTIYFAAAKTRVTIAITDELIESTKKAVERVRELSTGGVLPLPLVDSPKCNGCSLIGICLPDEVNAFKSLIKISGPLRLLHPARDSSLPLHVQEQGARIGLSGECLMVKSRDENKQEKSTEVPLAHTSQVCVYGNVQISTQALREMLYRNIPLSFFTTGGWYCGRTVGTDSKNAEVRIAQYKKAADPTFARNIASGLVSAKIANCRTFLRRNGEALRDSAPWIPRDLDLAVSKAGTASSIESLLGVEGNAAKLYFEHFSSMLRPPSSTLAFAFGGRNRRPPRDPVNALLSFAYSLLVKDFTVTLHAVGLEPLIGFYHQPRFGRPSLALDLMEEFRPIIADSVVVTTINTGVVTERDFVKAADSVALTSAGRKNFIAAYERRMDSEVTHPVFGYKISYRRVIEVQCRLLTRVLLGEIPDYPHFLVR